MSLNPNDIRIGSVFKKNNRILKVIDKHHVKLSKGGACQQVKCIDIQDKSIMEMRLNVNETLEDVYMSKKVLTFSYTSGDLVNFVDDEYSGIELTERELGILTPLFKVDIESNVIPKILQTADSIKGETAKSADKPAVLEGGIKTKVPPHVNIGDYAVLSKVDLSYVSKR